MAILGTQGKVTLLDMVKSMGPDGQVLQVAELLSQNNEILTDMSWIEGNMPTGHKAAIRTGIPQGVWRQFYQGVPPVKTQRAQVMDACAMLENRTEVDVKEANLNGNLNAFRMSESTGIVEGLNQQMATALIYGNQSLNPEQFNGLAPRYSTIAGAANAQNIIDAGGTASNNTSIWLTVWGPQTLTGIYPKGSTGGLNHKDLGEIDAFDANQNRFRAYADLWQWDCGLHVKDWRYAVRIANIDVNALIAESGAADLTKLMIKAMARIPTMGMGTPVFYANRTVKEMLSIQALNKSQNALGITEAARQYGGVEVSIPELKFFGVPVRTVDAIVSNEARVT